VFGLKFEGENNGTIGEVRYCKEIGGSGMPLGLSNRGGDVGGGPLRGEDQAQM